MDLHGINPRDIKPLTGGPINRLFWAINHYVSTGDHIGEGVATQRDGAWVLCILVYYKKEQDCRDIAALRSRLSDSGLPRHELAYGGKMGEVEIWNLIVADVDVLPLADALVSAPGALGWGSGKAVIDRYEWRHE